MLGLFGFIKKKLDLEGKLPDKWKDSVSLSVIPRLDLSTNNTYGQLAEQLAENLLTGESWSSPQEFISGVSNGNWDIVVELQGLTPGASYSLAGTLTSTKINHSFQEGYLNYELWDADYAKRITIKQQKVSGSSTLNLNETINPADSTLILKLRTNLSFGGWNGYFKLSGALKLEQI